MGQGAFFSILNLDTWTRRVLDSPASLEVYDNGKQGSNFSAWAKKTIAPLATLPPLPTPPQYVESSRVKFIGTLRESYFTLKFDNGGSAKVRITPATWVECTGDVAAYCEDHEGRKHARICLLPEVKNHAGREKYLVPDPANWMGTLNAQSNKKSFFQLPLYRVSFPASHDSGSTKAIKTTSLATDATTQTQTLDILGQLKAGIRYFDMRPCVLKKRNPHTRDSFYFGHVGSAGGALGQGLVSGLKQVRSFIDEHSQEIVMLKFSHYTDCDDVRLDKAHQVTMLSAIQGELKGVMHTAQPGEKITKKSLQSIIDSGKRVICLFDDLDGSLIKPGAGILRYGSANASGIASGGGESNFDVFDEYSNSPDLNKMKCDQLEKYRRFSPGSTGAVFLLSYTLTFGTVEAIAATLDTGTGMGRFKKLFKVKEFSLLTLAEFANNNLWDYAKLVFPVRSGAHQPPNFVYIDLVDDKNAVSAAIYFNKQNPAVFPRG